MQLERVAFFLKSCISELRDSADLLYVVYVRQIAAEVNICKTLVYLYFKNKSAKFEVLSQRAA